MEDVQCRQLSAHSNRAAVMEDVHVQYWRLRKMYSVHNSLHTAQYQRSSYGKCTVYITLSDGYERCTVYTTLCTQHSDRAAVMEDVQVYNFV